MSLHHGHPASAMVVIFYSNPITPCADRHLSVQVIALSLHQNEVLYYTSIRGESEGEGMTLSLHLNGVDLRRKIGAAKLVELIKRVISNNRYST